MSKQINTTPIVSAELVLFCEELRGTLDFYTERLGFQLQTIFPADNPAIAVLSGFGMRIRLEIGNTDVNESVVIRLNCDLSEATERIIIAPNRVRFELWQADPPLTLPKLKSNFLINRFDENADWIEGRAEMRYRDLIPDRLGGHMIASHIHVPSGGRVPDYVHFHKVCVQIIYCWKGWAKLVYEDQGEPFIFREGDCVLQPSEIRHRVLESSENLEVIEISSPAEHETHRDHLMTLPTPIFNPERDFGGQRFIHHKAGNAVWNKWIFNGFMYRDTQIKSASNSFADVKIIRANSAPGRGLFQQDKKLLFVFILRGRLSLNPAGEEPEQLSEGDSVVVPSKKSYQLSECSADVEFLLVKFL